MNQDHQELPKKFSLKEQKPKRRKVLTAELNKSGSFIVDSEDFAISKKSQTPNSNSPYKLKKGKKGSQTSLNVLIKDKDLIENNKKKNDILMKTRSTLSMVMGYDTKVGIACLLMLLLKSDTDYSKDHDYPYFGGYRNIRNDFLKIKVSLFVFVIGSLYASCDTTWTALKKMSKKEQKEGTKAERSKKKPDEMKLSEENSENAKFYYGFLIICFIEAIFFFWLISAYEYIPIDTKKSDLIYYKKVEKANPSKFSGSLESKMPILPYISLIISIFRITILQTLISKRLYHYKLSFIMSIVFRSTIFLLLLKMVNQLNLEWDIFLSINWLLLALFCGISFCLILYLINKLVKCRFTKHLIFTIVLTCYFISNTIFIYLGIYVFEEEEGTSKGYRRRSLEQDSEGSYDPYNISGKLHNKSPMKVGNWFNNMLIIILLIKIITIVVYCLLKRKMIDYYALFYEDGFFNPFISEKNVIEYEEKEEEEVNIDIPLYIKRKDDNAAVYKTADDKDWMQSTHSVSPKKSLIHGSHGRQSPVMKSSLQRRNSIRRSIITKQMKQMNMDVQHRNSELENLDILGEAGGRRSSFAIDSSIKRCESPFLEENLAEKSNFYQHEEVNETKIKQFDEGDSDFDHGYANFDDEEEEEKEGEEGNIYSDIMKGAAKNRFEEKYEKSSSDSSKK